MSSLRSTQIDIDVHKCIEAGRESFGESQNDILRRLLGLSPKKRPNGARPAVQTNKNAKAWFGKGITLPHGTQLRMEYNGHRHLGEIRDGEWLVEGKRFRSPSAAAGGVARTRAGKRPSLDGWIYWHVKRPTDGQWILLKAVREQAEFRVRPATLDEL